ncbi:MAG TPA: PliI family lysozyme inhibitor of I-type lysozyme, partial [Candidatus Limnocylindria bacterium]|nr:PliI family lysozyme inhibitor of I-type lysozyme [Candidatus Limnocylindria bacterium]
SATEPRFAKMFQIPGSRETVVVAEGDFEPRSVGSYALRVYGGASQKSPMDDFIVGVIRPRNGTIEAVKFDTVDGDDQPEIVVIIRSAGTGGYLSADAWSYRAGSLELVLSVSDLDKAADTIQALRDKVRAPNARQASVE